jgi:hypothetical protein
MAVEDDVNTDLLNSDIYIGFSNLQLPEEAIEFSRGISLRPAFAHLMSPMMMAFASPGPQGFHPPPWKSTRGGFGQDITAELYIPKNAADTFNNRFECAKTIAFLIRLWATPELTIPAIANMPFLTIRDADEGVAHIVPIEHKRRYFAISTTGPHSKDIGDLDWVVAHFEIVLKMRKESTEFMLASYSFDAGQFVENPALVLISLWGALEVLFSPSTTELKFRISSLIAAYLKPPGNERRAEQKRIAALYDKRSAAAHGRPSHSQDDLFRTYELLRFVLIEHVKRGKVPTKDDLEATLFGVEA